LGRDNVSLRKGDRTMAFETVLVEKKN